MLQKGVIIFVKQSLAVAYLLIIFSFPFSAFAVSNADYHLKGVKGKVEDNINAYLHTLSLPKGNNFSHFESKVINSIEQAIQVFGYYQPSIVVNLTLDDDDLIVYTDIDLGPRVRVTRVNVKLQGDGRQDPSFQAQLRKNPLHQGDFLSHQRYDSFKADLNKLALERGYFDATWVVSRVAVTIAKSAAEIELILDTEQRYVFGDISLPEDTESGALILELSPFKPGQPFESKLVAEYSLALFDSRYFQSAAVVPDINDRQAGVVPMTVNVINHPNNTYEVGVGFSSDLGFRGHFSWTKPWLNWRGDSITTELEYSTVQQEYSLNYDIPLEDPNINVARIQLGYQHKNNEDTKSDLYTLQFQRQFELPSKWLRTWFIKLEREDFIQGTQEDSTLMIIPGISFARTEQRGGINPFWGNQHLLTTEVADPIWGADVRMAKIQGRAKYLRSLNNTHFLTSRFDLGAIAVDDISDVPASMRFFAGGNTSVRGYGYESIAPKDNQNKLIGGQYLTVGSVEYGYQILERWRLGTFVDIGTATNDFSEQPSIGVGTGIRWQTPIGPVKLDLAFPINSEDRSAFMIHLNVGPEL